MAKIPKKTLEDLEYFEVLRQCSGFAITPLGKEACLAILPVIDENQLVDALNAVSEFKSSFENENRIPNHGFEPLISVFSLLSIENSVLDISVFRVIAANTDTTNVLLQFLEKFRTY
ncbi:MAG: DNA mismatch repair protein MutS, partial [Flavobacteriaceae bacterium]|nr:DNA mismatch repair protein MutS [Flavobacteriaceae bacterium]